MASLRMLSRQFRRSYATQTLGTRYVEKVVIVTGAGKGIGRGIAEAFAQQGSKVMVADLDPEAGKMAVSDIQAQGGQADFVQCDVSSNSSLQELIDATISQHDRLDCVVNNAGWHPPHFAIDDFTEQQCLDLLQLNFMSVFSLCRMSLPHLRRSQGNIINISSMVAEQGQLEACTYAATKGAVTSFSKAIAIDEAKHNVRVNILSPGNVWTPMWAAACPTDPDALREAYNDGSRQQVLGRFGTIKEAGDMAVFIAAEATFSTGQNFILTGGTELGYGLKLATEGSQLD
eukprot:m.12074 g.12074  ORF g.12074 m.12074 type:complete len:288 (-) comp9897_c0_seq2:122-985(-)